MAWDLSTLKGEIAPQEIAPAKSNPEAPMGRTYYDAKRDGTVAKNGLVKQTEKYL